MRIKVKMIDGEWFTSSSFKGGSIIINLSDFYGWNVEGHIACCENKDLIYDTYKLVGFNFNKAILLYYTYKNLFDKGEL